MSRICFDSWGRELPLAGEAAAEASVMKGREAILDNPAAGRRVAAVLAWDGLILAGGAIDLLDLLRTHMAKVQSVSCGKCYPCRVGTAVVGEILERLTGGRVDERDFDQMERIGALLRDSSLCGLGCTTSKPLLDCVRLLRQEFRRTGRLAAGPEPAGYASILTAPCQDACPIQQPIPDYLDTVRDGRYRESFNYVMSSNPLPNIIGRVCPHPCEDACIRGQVDEPISICQIKRFNADAERGRSQCDEPFELENRVDPSRPKVAVVGAGPAGLVAAWDLARLGYPVTIFEQFEVPAGTCWLGIPEYRAPRDVVWEDVRRIQAVGAELRLGTAIGPDLTLDDLRRQGYRAIFLGVGALRGKRLGVPGEDAFEGVLDCVEFLKAVNLGRWEGHPPRNVVVVGAGDSAMDAARTALRLGCGQATILYRRSREEAPAHEWELREAEEEGVQFLWLAAPKEILGRDGRVTGILAQRMELGPPDASGRRRPVPVEGQDFVVECDMIVPAVSQEPDLEFLGPDAGLKVNKWGILEADPDTFQTNIPDIFAGGDVVTGPRTAVEAMGHGHDAARSIDHYLSGRQPAADMAINYRKILRQLHHDERECLTNRDLPPAPRVHDEHLDPARRSCDFREFSLGYTPQEAARETSRCLKCYRVATFLLAPLGASEEECQVG